MPDNLTACGMEAIYAPEGRLAAVYDGNGAAITYYRAEYWLKGINSASTGFGQGTKAVEWSYAAKYATRKAKNTLTQTNTGIVARQTAGE